MLDPRLTDVAVVRPGFCALCRSVNGPFVDTGADLPSGRIYVCAHTCGSQIADLCSSQVVAAKDAELAASLAEVQALQFELAQAEASRVVPLADVREWLTNGVTTLPVARCAATRKDGSPCTASALPGRETCVAHAKAAAA
jgi:hypothetical protein